MDDVARQLDIDRLREDIGAKWSDLRDSVRLHIDEDDRRFSDLTGKIDDLTGLMKQWSGSFAILKWAAGLGIPAIVGLLITQLARHW